MNLRERVERALERGDRAAAWAALDGAAPADAGTATEGDARDHALLVLAVGAHDPSHEGLAERAAGLARTFAHDAEVAVAACAALNAIAARRPPDAPPREGGAEALALEVADAALVGDPPVELRAYLLVNRAQALRALGPERDAEAVAAYGAAIVLAPDRGAWHFELGVLHKWRGRWDDAALAFAEAKRHLGETRGVRWNEALVATARGRGADALEAWQALGLAATRPEDAAPDRLPQVPDLPPLRVRVPAKASGYGPPQDAEERRYEVVWVAPLTPGHGVVQSPTFDEAPIDYGDVVLWDGAPVAEEGVGLAGEPPRRVPVFPLLEILRRGDERRYRFVAQLAEGDLAAMMDALPGGCRAFAHGAPSEGLAYGKLVVPAGPDLKDVRARLEAVLAARRTLRFAIPGLYEATADAKRAGLEHQAWRGIERRAGVRGADA
ncbi:MAG: hypothetical protein AAGH15_09025 [Myxococcota bacterium]